MNQQHNNNQKSIVKSCVIVILVGVSYIVKYIMDVFLMIRRKNMTIFTNATEHTSVLELKNMIEGIIKIPPVNQQLFKDNIAMTHGSCLSSYGITSVTAKPQCPALVGLAIRLENGHFEPLSITPYSLPPDLPDVMKSQESSDFEHIPGLIPKH